MVSWFDQNGYAGEIDPGGWSGWQEIEVEPAELPPEEPPADILGFSDGEDQPEDGGQHQPKYLLQPDNLSTCNAKSS